jgi:diguanylate cyclase (GGDEF)-like protein
MGRDSGDVASENVGPAEALLAELAALLASSASGLAFVYDGLELLATRWKLADAVVVVETPSTGPQAFRLGRRPLEGSWATGIAAAGPHRGLHTEPVILEPDVADGFVALAEIGLRLDVLDHDAAHDSLTGLLNRRSFDAMLDQALARSKRYGWPFSLVMFDLNRFKSLNDRLGHAAGDQVLREVGSVLRSSLRAGDVAARIGGDEFAVLLTHGDRPSGQVLAARVHDIVNANLDWADIGFAVGSATAPTEAKEAHDLYQLADRRLYEAKAG